MNGYKSLDKGVGKFFSLFLLTADKAAQVHVS